jgi:adenosylhomocysteine nucleosidase
MLKPGARKRIKLPNPKPIAIVAALDREVSSLVKHWHVRHDEHAGRTFSFYENENAVLICGGIGAQAARRAAEAVISLYQPTMIYSVGFAGATDSNSQIGDIIIPRHVVDASDSSSTDTGMGEGILVTSAAVATPEQKSKLRTAYNAQAVDMEAAAVAKAATARGIRFAAVKAISDQNNFALPPMENFIAADGTFSSSRFALFVIFRPWMWRKVVKLRSGSIHAANALCQALGGIASGANLQSAPTVYPVKAVHIG